VTDALVKELLVDRIPADAGEKRPGELADLSGKIAVVTGGGGAGSGLGSACVDRLAAAGAVVVVLDLDGYAGRRAASSASERWGVETDAIQVDAADWDAVHGIAEDVAERFGSLDIWVNNVGGGSPSIPFVDEDREGIERMLSRNLTSTLTGTHAALQVMRRQRSGNLINVASETGRVVVDGASSVYSLAKAAVIRFTAHVAHEVGPLGISVVAVLPGAMLNDHRIAELRGLEDDETGIGPGMRHGVAGSSLGRPSSPFEVANVVAFLASPAAGYIQGTSVSVSGGLGS
jgi:3-oxoacyl-[acyl-carrier protein] reductase